MKITYPSGQRQDWLNRNALYVGLNFLGTLAPHVANTRATYTVPAGKRAMIVSWGLQTVRVTAAGTPDAFWIGVHLNDGTYNEYIAIAWNVGNSVSSGNGRHMSTQVPLKAGDVVSLITADLSTGGTVSHAGHVAIIEFDA